MAKYWATSAGLLANALLRYAEFASKWIPLQGRKGALCGLLKVKRFCATTRMLLALCRSRLSVKNRPRARRFIEIRTPAAFSAETRPNSRPDNSETTIVNPTVSQPIETSFKTRGRFPESRAQLACGFHIRDREIQIRASG